MRRVGADTLLYGTGIRVDVLISLSKLNLTVHKEALSRSGSVIFFNLLLLRKSTCVSAFTFRAKW